MHKTLRKALVDSITSYKKCGKSFMNILLVKIEEAIVGPMCVMNSQPRINTKPAEKQRIEISRKATQWTLRAAIIPTSFRFSMLRCPCNHQRHSTQAFY